MRIVLLGNAGSGKSTLARRLIGDKHIARLSLDEIAWKAGTERRTLTDSVTLLDAFLAENDQWVIDGCYSDLVAHALPHCDELLFLNPGVETCIAHCRQRPWEPEKFASAEEQDAMLETLLEWVGCYETRDDEYGLRRHRRLFENFAGKKHELRSVDDYQRV